MIDALPRLLKTYEFLSRALVEHGPRLGPSVIVELETERDQTFVEILTHVAADPRVTLAQLEFILSNLDRYVSDPAVLPSVQAACARHLKLLARQVQRLQATAAVPRPENPVGNGAHNAGDFSSLDLISDRAAVLDLDFRYVFCNRANADFHRTPASEFIGRLNPEIVGDTYFRTTGRPRYEQCFAGKPLSFVSSHPLRDVSHLYSVTLDPVRDGIGRVFGVLVVARDVSHLPLPPELNVYRREAGLVG